MLMGNGSRQSVIIRMKQEKFTLGSDIKGIPHFFCFFYHFLQNISGISFKRCSVRFIHITNQSCNFSLLWSPRKYLQGVKIRLKIQIRFFQFYKSVNRCPIKHTAMVNHRFQLASGNCHIFHRSKYIRKLQTDKFHIFFFHKIQYIIFCIHL